MNPVPGMHHVTAIASDPQRNLDFYTQVLGLRLVKLTVNFDDPGSYHFYFADETATLGSLLTFFPWPGAARGGRGAGQANAVAFSAPIGSHDYWQRRLAEHGVEAESFTRLGEQGVAFDDPDGLRLEIVSHLPSADAGSHAIAGFHSVTVTLRALEPTERLLVGMFGYRRAGEEGDRLRYVAEGAALGRVVDVVVDPAARRAPQGAGVVHHVAFRAGNQASQRDWRARVADAGFNVTEVVDRTYFRSIYFRERGGVLIEMATDEPGVVIDEPVESLGTRLMLPPQYEPNRAAIERGLPAIRLPQAAGAVR